MCIRDRGSSMCHPTCPWCLHRIISIGSCIPFWWTCTAGDKKLQFSHLWAGGGSSGPFTERTVSFYMFQVLLVIVLNKKTLCLQHTWLTRNTLETFQPGLGNEKPSNWKAKKNQKALKKTELLDLEPPRKGEFKALNQSQNLQMER